jgi:hypothetical protein
MKLLNRRNSMGSRVNSVPLHGATNKWNVHRLKYINRNANCIIWFSGRAGFHFSEGYSRLLMNQPPITVAAQSKAWNVLARSNTGTVGSNPTWGMDVCVYFVFFFCVGSDLAAGWSPSIESYRLCMRLRNWKKRPGLKLGSRAINSGGCGGGGGGGGGGDSSSSSSNSKPTRY